jgi:hypothetical protein
VSYSGPLKKNGEPDMRYAGNREAAGLGNKNVDGSFDMRKAVNKNKK